MLAVVSAVVAFDRWPNGQVSTRVQTLVLTDKPAPIRVSARATGLSAAPAARTAAGSLAAVPRALPNGAGVTGERLVGGRTTPTTAAPANPLSKVVPPAVTDPLEPVQRTTAPIIDTISNPSTTAGAVADGAQSVTDAAGVGLARISPQVGEAVAGAGQTAAETVRELPLPQHVLPGH